MNKVLKTLCLCSFICKTDTVASYKIIKQNNKLDAFQAFYMYKIHAIKDKNNKLFWKVENMLLSLFFKCMRCLSLFTFLIFLFLDDFHSYLYSFSNVCSASVTFISSPHITYSLIVFTETTLAKSQNDYPLLRHLIIPNLLPALIFLVITFGKLCLNFYDAVLLEAFYLLDGSFCFF